MSHVEVCPRCHIELAPVSDPVGYRCERCSGHAFALGQLRRVVDEDAVNALWQAARAGEAVDGDPCPSCRRSMSTVHTHDVDQDVCGVCQIAWFDAGETRRLPPRPPGPRPAPEDDAIDLPEDVLVAMALAEARRARVRAYGDIPSVPYLGP